MAELKWVKPAYYRFHEPRIVYAIYGASYTAAMISSAITS